MFKKKETEEIQTTTNEEDINDMIDDDCVIEEVKDED